jgi:hypothetical protein
MTKLKDVVLPGSRWQDIMKFEEPLMSRYLLPAGLALGLLTALAPTGAYAQRVSPERVTPRGGDARSDMGAGGAAVAPVVPHDHKCQSCGQPAVIAIAGDHGPAFYCAKHLPTGIGFAPPGQAPPAAAATKPAVPAGTGTRVVGFPLGDAALYRGGNAEDLSGVDYGVTRGDESGDSRDRRGARDRGDTRDRSDTRDTRDTHSTRDDRRSPRDPDRPR